MFVAIYDALYCFYFLTGLRLASKVCTWIVSINFLQFCLPYFGGHLSIFLLTKLISYPWILIIHCLCISLSIGIPCIGCCISQIGKMLLGPQENMIRIRLFLGLLFQYLSHRIQSIPPQTSVELRSPQARWVSGTIWWWIDCYLVSFLLKMKFLSSPEEILLKVTFIPHLLMKLLLHLFSN